MVVETRRASAGRRDPIPGPLGDPDTKQYLRSLRLELSRSVAPDVSTDRARSVLEMAGSLIDYLIARERIPNACGNPAEIEQDIVQAIRSVRANDANAAARARKLTRESIASQKSLFAEIDAAETQSRYSVPTNPEDTRHILRMTISAYLSERFGGDIRVSELGKPLGGYSKDVFVIALTGNGRPADRMVLRRDLSNGPLESRVADEFVVMQAMHKHGVPVPKPLFYESNEAVLGGPFIGLEFVSGAPVGNYRGELGAADVKNAMRQFAGILGRVHSLDPLSAGLLLEGDRQPLSGHVTALIRSFENQWRKRRVVAMPIIAAGLEWMHRLIPPDDETPLAIVHGDPTLRNVMIDNGQPTALLDWETWHLGDPAEDLAYCRDEVQNVMDWDEFVTLYRNAGGPAVDPKRLDYWSFWKFLRGAITSISMMDALEQEEPADLRTAFGGMFFTRMCISEISIRLDAWLDRAGVAPMELK